MRRPWLCAVALGVLLSCGPPVSKQPLTPPEKSAPDKALLGHWVGHGLEGDAKEDKEVELDVTVKEGGVMSFRMPPEKPDGHPLVFIGHASQLSSMKVLNLLDRTEGQEPAQEYIFIRYELGKDGGLTMWMLREEPLEQAIKSGALKGKVEGSPSSVTLTDEPAALVRFFEKAKKDELFGKFAVFHRVAVKH